MATEEKTVPKSKREELNERLKAKYPDKDFENDDVFYGQIADDFDNQGKELDDYKAREKDFADLFTRDPDSATFISEWGKGEDPVLLLVRRFGDRIKDAMDNPEMQDEIAKANKEYIDRVTKSKELEDEYNKNIGETIKYLNEVSQKGEISEDKIDEAVELLMQIVHDGIVGKFTPETIDMAIKAINHDEDVEEADYEGEVRGRNAKIDEKLKKNEKGDGTAQLDGQNNRGGAGRRMPQLGALDRFDDGTQDIWERGGAKRIRAQR